MSLIPGASVIGCGFNILGSYSTRSVMSRIVSLGGTHSTWQYPPTGITYDVPDNASPIAFTNTTRSSYLYNTRDQFQRHFTQKAGASTSSGAFSEQFNLAYSQTVSSDVSYFYGIYEADFTAWQLKVDQTSANWLSPEFLDDPDVQALPATFTPQNKELFFTVFRKWGTHFVAQVVVGGSLDYYEAVMSSYSSNQQQVSANIQLEYKAVFMSSKAESQTDWQQLGQNWANSRTVTVNATGGDNSPLNALNPAYGDSDQTIFTTWSSAVMQNPSVIEFTLRSLDRLFSGATAAAVQDALYAYTNGTILADGATDYTPGTGPAGGNISTQWGILVNGTVTQPHPPVTAPPPDVVGPRQAIPVGGYQIALLDPDTYQPLMSHLYYQTYPAGSGAPDPSIYTAIMADIDTIPPSTYVAVVVGFAIDLLNYPSQAFSRWLMSVGATMTGWKKFIGYNDKGGLSNYVCVGRQGFASGQAIETFQAVHSPHTWLNEPSLFTMNATALVLTYGGTDLSVTGPRAFGSLATPTTHDNHQHTPHHDHRADQHQLTGARGAAEPTQAAKPGHKGP